MNKEQENKQLKERYERLKQEHIDTITRNEEKQQRINKAIEYINKHTNKGMFELRSDTNEIVELLDILKGVDKK